MKTKSIITLLGLILFMTFSPTLLSADTIPALDTAGTDLVVLEKETMPANDSITNLVGIEVPDGNPFTEMDLPTLILWENFFYHIGLLALTWFSGFFPGLKDKRIPIRTIIIGALLIGIMIAMRSFRAEPITYIAIITYIGNWLMTTQAYDKIYKELFGGSIKSDADVLSDYSKNVTITR